MLDAISLSILVDVMDQINGQNSFAGQTYYKKSLQATLIYRSYSKI